MALPKTIEGMLNLSAEELKKLSSAELREITNSMVSVANKRIKRIEKAGYGFASGALGQRRTKSGAIRKFTSKLPKSVTRKIKPVSPDMTAKQRARQMKYLHDREVDIQRSYLSKIGQLRNFLSAPSSTLEGAKKSAERIAEDLGATDYSELSRNQQNKFWKAYNELKKKYPDLMRSDGNRYMSLRTELFDFMIQRTRTGKKRLRNIEDSVNHMFETLDANYRRMQRGEIENADARIPDGGENTSNSLLEGGSKDFISW